MVFFFFSTYFPTKGRYNAARLHNNENDQKKKKKRRDDDEQISSVFDYYTRQRLLHKGTNEIKVVNGAEDNRKTW